MGRYKFPVGVTDVQIDDAGLDAFGRVPVSLPETLFDAQQEYGLNTRTVWGAAANGTLAIASSNGSAVNGSNAVGPTDANTRMTPITVSSTNGHYAVLQSQQYTRYIPGKGHKIFVTGIFAAGANAAASLVLRTSTSGSVSDAQAVAQTDWSVDTFSSSGRNPSGITIDFTKIQILVIDAQMLYAGRVRIGFDIDGVRYWAHYFKIANEQILPTMQTFNLPVRIEGRTGASTTDFRVGYFDAANGVFLKTSRTSLGGTINFECCSVQSDGGRESRGVPRSAPPSTISTIAVTTRRPIMSIRPRATFNGRTNRAHIEALAFALRATTNDSLYEVIVGGTLTGASFVPVGNPVAAGSFVTGVSYVIRSVGTTDFTLIGAASNTIGVVFTATGAGAGSGTAVQEESVADYDISATAITGGVIANQDFVTTGSGVTAGSANVITGIRNPLTLSQIDVLAATQTPITLVCTALSGTSNVSSVANWQEQVI